MQLKEYLSKLRYCSVDQLVEEGIKPGFEVLLNSSITDFLKHLKYSPLFKSLDFPSHFAKIYSFQSNSCHENNYLNILVQWNQRYRLKEMEKDNTVNDYTIKVTIQSVDAALSGASDQELARDIAAIINEIGQFILKQKAAACLKPCYEERYLRK